MKHYLIIFNCFKSGLLLVCVLSMMRGEMALNVISIYVITLFLKGEDTIL